ncbi:cytochrome C [Tahibacter amnicola]|uniref:Cytochrome C n=1 Tax=Tahibacter amnicola TaxID=2976241 RepID=A0ABY6BL83_9GAMM|nr:cytochrome C [Tahibacter amnicola]UXI70183.1 cytochrome C [Tahibacter amnicola]
MRTFTLGLMFLLTFPAAAAPPAGEMALIERGRYLLEIGGCHDCHTPGYTMQGGNAPKDAWLTGDRLGWQGAWGTTYAPNLRLRLNDMDLSTWVAFARTMKSRPPMPYWALNRMSETDLSAIWHVVKWLGKAGDPAPAALPAGAAAAGPVVRFPEPPPSAKTSRPD